MPFNTGNAIGSSDTRDLSDNAENFDIALGTLSATWIDRLGVTRDSFEGRLAKGSFYRVGTFADGYTLTNMRQTLEYDGNEYGWNGVFPKVVSAGSTPETSGGVSELAWVFRSDASLRADLLAPSGATLVGTSSGGTVEQRLSNQDTIIAGKANIGGSESQQFSVADGTQSHHAVSKGQLDITRRGLYVNASVSSGAMTWTLPKQTLTFRNPSLSVGTPVDVELQNDLTLTIPSGANLGTTSNILANLAPVVFYNGGNPVLGVSNLAGGLDLSDGQLFNTTAISTSANSASVIYASSVVSNSPAIFLPPVQITEAVAGVWATAPTLVQPALNQNTVMFERRMFVPLIATTSGAAIDQAIPSWARRITILFKGVSTSGTSAMLLRLGNPTIAVTGYSSVAFNSTTNSVANASDTTGFRLMYAIGATSSLLGSAVLVSPDGVSWIESSTMSDIVNATSLMSSGGVTLSGLAKVLRLTTVNGTDTFDAGSISLLIEG